MTDVPPPAPENESATASTARDDTNSDVTNDDVSASTDREASTSKRAQPDWDQRPRWQIAVAIYAVLTLIYLACASSERLVHHTPYNHFAHLACGWLQGRLDMGGPPPAYAAGNDFALFHERWFIVFPAFPAVLLLPAALLAREPEAVRDGLIFVLVAGAGPAALFIALERMRDAALSKQSTRVSALFASLLGLGTVFWFTAEQGTVWFAAHVVGVVLAATYLALSIEARSPLLAGLAIGLGFWTRTPLLFAAPFFVSELWRVDRDRFAKRLALFVIPIALLLALSFAHNHARFGDPFEVGYRFLTVGWKARIEKWGLMSYHFLARNMGVALTSLPFWNPHPTATMAPLQVSAHGVALWVTSPFYLWLLRPRSTSRAYVPLLITAIAVAMPSLLYQNTGQSQFGYRFSNDYAVFLFALLAIGTSRPSRWFIGAAVWAVLINFFGAISFERAGWQRWYFYDGHYQVFQQD